jgi:poly(A) polymerase
MEQHVKHRIFDIIATESARLGVKAYVIGGWVRDLLLDRLSKDIDIVTEGDGPELALAVSKALKLKKKPDIFENFGTARLRYRNWDVEFVGARKESYLPESRKPEVRAGSFKDDQMRRDFSINAMAISLNENDFGALIDPFDGVGDLKKKLIRTPLEPGLTFSDDPLRMMRAVRFAAQLNFSIDPKCYMAIRNHAARLHVVSVERVMDEFNKIMLSDKPGQSIMMLHDTGLLPVFFPELEALSGVEMINGKGHKDNLLHTCQVLDNLAERSDDLWLRWAALLHDIAKPATKKYDELAGWTFHGHEFLGSKMVKHIFRRLRLPQNEKMKFVEKLVLLHLRPIVLSQNIVTDSAVRRLLFEAGDDIDALMLLCEADITSGNRDKVRQFLKNFSLVRDKLAETEEKDRLRNWQPPVSGDDIMQAFGLTPCREVGIIKTAIREAILEGEIPNEKEAAFAFMLETGKKMGLQQNVS